VGWTKTYDFNDSDQEMASLIIDDWVFNAANGKSNINPDKIPWDAIKTLIRETVYGGKIDCEHDQLLLDTFVNNLFTASSFDSKFSLLGVGEGQLNPEGTKMPQIVEWVNQLPDQQPPTWLGLPSSAEKVLRITKGKKRSKFNSNRANLKNYDIHHRE
jgi:dynein heavy chain 1, cytosolic